MGLTPQLLNAMKRVAPALGGAPLGNLFHAVPDQQARDLVRRAYAAGIGYFDTAPHYGNGLSERRLGAVLRSVPRSTFVLSTKVGRLLHPDPNPPSAQNGYVDVAPCIQSFDYTRDGVSRSLAASRQRMGIDAIDVVYVHDPDRATHGEAFPQHFRAMLDGGLPALADLKAAGSIRAYGIGVNGVDTCLETLRHSDLDVILLAGRYTLADQTALAALLPLCIKRKVSVVLGGPYNSGILATGANLPGGACGYFDYAPAPEPILQRVAALEAVGHAHDVPLQAAALQFPLAHPAIVAVLAGARSVAELEQNIAMSRFPIPASYWAELRARKLVDPSAPIPGELPR